MATNKRLYDLQKFIDAQQGIYDQALRELKAGHKQTHWIWFIFPQLAGLGKSETARHYSIRSLDEARAYLNHPLLGPRLRECTLAVNSVVGRTAHQIFGSPDDLKFCSSVTLFMQADPSVSEFKKALKLYYSSIPDNRTLELLNI